MKKTLLLGFMLLLTGCFGGGGPIPQDQFYRLADITYDGDKLKTIAGVIAVLPLDSDVLHRERAILYSEVNEPLKLQRYHYHHWSHIPPKLIQDSLASYLQTSGIARQVVRYGEQSRVDAEIGGQLKRFERVVGVSNTTVVVQLALSYKTRGHKPEFYQHVYIQEVAADNASMYATALAFSQALQTIYAKFIKDLYRQLSSSR